MAIKTKSRITVDPQITLVPYYPNYATTLPWYQDKTLCKQVDDREEPYDLDRLKRMYRYLDHHGDLFYIKYNNRLCGDVCLQDNGEINIVITQPYQNRHIGRRVIHALIQLAITQNRTKVYARIYPFNMQSIRMFESAGFIKAEHDFYEYRIF